MSSPNPLIAPTTAAVQIQYQAQHADQVVFYATGTWGIGENASVMFPTTTGTLVPYNDASIGAVVVGSTPATTIPLMGGVLYTIDKPSTLAAAGIDVQYKPRIGPH